MTLKERKGTGSRFFLTNRYFVCLDGMVFITFCWSHCGPQICSSFYKYLWSHSLTTTFCYFFSRRFANSSYLYELLPSFLGRYFGWFLAQSYYCARTSWYSFKGDVKAMWLVFVLRFNLDSMGSARETLCACLT